MKGRDEVGVRICSMYNIDMQEKSVKLNQHQLAP